MRAMWERRIVNRARGVKRKEGERNKQTISQPPLSFSGVVLPDLLLLSC